MVCLPRRFSSSVFCWLMLLCVLSPPIVFLPVIWKMSYAWRVAEYWVVPCSSFYRTWHWGWHRRQMFLSSYVRPRYWQLFWPYCPFGRKRSQEVSYTDLLSLCWVWACWYSPDITFGWFTDSSGFPVMGVLQPCHSESHPEIFSGFHHQKNIFLWHNNNSAHFPFSAFIDKACCIAGQWSVEQSPFFRCHSFVCLLSVVEYCRKTTGDDTGIQLSLSESSCHNGWGDYIPTWGGDPSRDRRNRLGSLGCISGYQKLPSSKQYCYKKASGLSSVYFIITIIICRPHLVINLRFKQCFSFSSHQENTPFYLFLNETIDNHRFE